MTDKKLYQQIRQLVREQKQKNVLDSRQQNFAEEYCRVEMLKKRQLKQYEPNKMNNLFKNFKNVEGYINIMDIINNLHLFDNNQEQAKQNHQNAEQLPEIVPQSIQMKIKEQLGPILSLKYEQECQRREEVIQQLKSVVGFGKQNMERSNNYLQAFEQDMNSGKLTDRFELIDLLRKDIKKKQVYFLEKRFDKQMKDIEKVPKKIEHTKIFHKICSYLHMILEQEHKEKWASRQDKIERENRREHSRRLIRLSALMKPTDNKAYDKLLSTSGSFSRYNSDMKVQFSQAKPSQRSSLTQSISIGNKIYRNDSQQVMINERSRFYNKSKKQKSRNELLKDDFTFRKRNIKAGLMLKIHDFVDNINQEEKKNMEVSKKYGKALQSLSQEIKTSYGRFEREQIAQQQDISEMKRYIDNTLSRNKKDLKKFHHH